MDNFTSLAQKSRHYLKQVLPNTPMRRYYKAVADVKKLPDELQELDTALTYFAIENKELYDILYDTFILSLTANQLAKKYHYSKASIDKKRGQALEAFYKHVPENFK